MCVSTVMCVGACGTARGGCVVERERRAERAGAKPPEQRASLGNKIYAFRTIRSDFRSEGT